MPEFETSSLPASDEELLVRAGRGDNAAFSELYQRLSPRLYGYVMQMLRNESDSQDVLQEGFVQIWKRSAQYDPARSAVFTWSVLIMRHKAIDRIRRRQRGDNLTDRVADEPALDETESVQSPDRSAYLNEQKELVRTALDSIEPENRQPIELAFFKGYTQQQIAEVLKQPLGTVKARIRRGLLKLRTHLLKET